MTSTTDMTEHPDVGEISDLTEGLLPPSQSADLQRHLDICELCADVYASLEEIRGLLGESPEPLPMPAEVAARIDAALAAEALQPSVGDGIHVSRETPGTVTVSRETPSAATVSRETSHSADAPSRPDGSPPHVSRETSTPSDRPAGHARPATTGPGRKQQDRTRRRRTTVIGAAFAAAALGLGSVLLSSLMSGGASGPQANGDPAATTTDTFSTENLERQVSDLLATDRVEGQTTDGGGDPRTPKGSLEAEGQLDPPRVLQTPSVPDCVRSGIGRRDTALAVDEGVYKGTDAMLVVLPDANDISRVTAYIMDSSCIKRASAEIAKILFQSSYAHP
ncbi:hypothetical protein AB0D49_07880 [Streptomyces sp. NPDC048290]|uniref:anti-sigma factor family protein n=1 Tax=Streptomyces sp. NPDC048290 TaxID=3155811 RepID=UPI0034158F6E